MGFLVFIKNAAVLGFIACCKLVGVYSMLGRFFLCRICEMRKKKQIIFPITVKPTACSAKGLYSEEYILPLRLYIIGVFIQFIFLLIIIYRFSGV